MNYTLSELLKGCRLITSDDRILVQSIRNMELAFLTTDDEYSLDDQFSNPLAVDYENQNYGNLRIINSSEAPTISIPNVVVMTKHAAQNHAMMKSAFIKQMGVSSFNDAACVEGNQGGYIKKGDNIVRVLPLHLRPKALALTGVEGYNKFYRHINSFGNQLQVNTGSYIDPYFTKYDDQLAQFIAHFERPKRTIGVIVLVNGEIIAIDKFPSFTYCAQVWDVLVRDCYGAVALEAMLKDWQTPQEVYDSMFDKDVGDGEMPEDHLLDLVNTIKFAAGAQVEDEISKIADISFEATNEASNIVDEDRFDSYILNGDAYIGQVITSSNFHYMVNISASDVDFSPQAVGRRRRFIQEQLMAASQEPFEI